jgi:hypothetical protein
MESGQVSSKLTAETLMIRVSSINFYHRLRLKRMADDANVDEEHVPANATFESFGLDKWLVQAVSAMSIKHPTPIQAACESIPQLPIVEDETVLVGQRWDQARL